MNFNGFIHKTTKTIHFHNQIDIREKCETKQQFDDNKATADEDLRQLQP